MAHFSLMWLLQNELIQAIQLRNKDPAFCVTAVPLFQLEEAEGLKFLSLKKIPLGKFNETSQVLYISAVSLKLAKVCGQPAFNIAKTLANTLSASVAANGPQINQPNLSLLDGVWANFKIQASPPGWLYLNLSDKGIGHWLQLLNDTLPQAIEVVNQRRDRPPLSGTRQNSAGQPGDISGSSSLFSIQHTHARCCSLLSLAHRENLITLQNPEPEASLSHWRIIQPYPLPWLDMAGKLCLTEQGERQLIHQLVESIDVWAHCQQRLNHQPLLVQAHNLSKAFQGFHRNCPLWGEARNLTPALIQARLGLIRVTQIMLQMFLKRGLEAASPIHL